MRKRPVIPIYAITFVINIALMVDVTFVMATSPTWSGNLVIDCLLSPNQDISLTRFVCLNRLKQEAALKAVSLFNRRQIITENGENETLEIISTSTVQLNNVGEEQITLGSLTYLRMSGTAAVDASELLSKLDVYKDNAALKRQISALRQDMISRNPCCTEGDDVKSVLLDTILGSYYLAPADAQNLNQIRANRDREFIFALTNNFADEVFQHSTLSVEIANLYTSTGDAELLVKYAIEKSRLMPFLFQYFDVIELQLPRHYLYVTPRKDSLSQDLFRKLKSLGIGITIQFSGSSLTIPLTRSGSTFAKSCINSPLSDSTAYCVSLDFESRHIIDGLDFSAPSVLSYSLQFL